MTHEAKLRDRAAQARQEGDAALAVLLEGAAQQIQAHRTLVAMPHALQVTPPMLRRALELVAPEGIPEEEDAVLVLQQRNLGGTLAVFGYPRELGPAAAQRLDAPSLFERIEADGATFDPPPRAVAHLPAPAAPLARGGDQGGTAALGEALVDALAAAFARGQAQPHAPARQGLLVAEEILLGPSLPGDAHSAEG